MPLESCMILLDNSEYMRNGDYIPTRLEAQQDAANLLVGAKTQSHPESTVGVSAGTELLVSPTDDVGKILNALHDLRFHSKSIDVTASVQVASLALKHRRNKNGSQRIVLFVGSPLDGVDNRALAKAGRQLKKNNVSIDVVAMGELEANEEKLKELVDAANGRADDGTERTCHLVTIPAGVLPSDVLASSPWRIGRVCLCRLGGSRCRCGRWRRWWRFWRLWWRRPQHGPRTCHGFESQYGRRTGPTRTLGGPAA
jgi:26S proteasome regulatory subunit N10